MDTGFALTNSVHLIPHIGDTALVVDEGAVLAIDSSLDGSLVSVQASQVRAVTDEIMKLKHLTYVRWVEWVDVF